MLGIQNLWVFNIHHHYSEYRSPVPHRMRLDKVSERGGLPGYVDSLNFHHYILPITTHFLSEILEPSTLSFHDTCVVWYSSFHTTVLGCFSIEKHNSNE